MGYVCDVLHSISIQHCNATDYGLTTLCYVRSNVAEAHCYALQCRRIDCEQLSSSVKQQLIAGRFGHM